MDNIPILDSNTLILGNEPRFVLITGKPGTGKTTLSNILVDKGSFSYGRKFDFHQHTMEDVKEYMEALVNTTLTKAIESNYVLIDVPDLNNVKELEKIRGIIRHENTNTTVICIDDFSASKKFIHTVVTDILILGSERDKIMCGKILEGVRNYKKYCKNSNEKCLYIKKDKKFEYNSELYYYDRKW
jgi:archaellum biogenesis ATPase FlaH